MSILRICLFGRPRVYYESNPDEIKLTHCTLALLAYLLLYRHRTHPRDILSALFWGDQPQEKARNCLNTAIWRLRSSLESNGAPIDSYIISKQPGEVGFNLNNPYWLDVAAFEHQIGAALADPKTELVSLEQCLALYTGDLLEGFYEDWAIREREHQRQKYLGALGILMETAFNNGNYAKSLEFASKILAQDPLREEVHRHMMRAYVANGQRALAARQYETCRAILAAELGIEPMQETQALYESLIGPARLPPRLNERRGKSRRSRAAPGRSVLAHENIQPDLDKALAELEQARLAFDDARASLLAAMAYVEHLAKDE